MHFGGSGTHNCAIFLLDDTVYMVAGKLILMARNQFVVNKVGEKCVHCKNPHTCAQNEDTGVLIVPRTLLRFANVCDMRVGVMFLYHVLRSQR